ncbi:MAG: leucine-rich repeat domain-containing protein [Clostridiales bacterium]|nr:leucine-rich repeat domain-containing protein [Clostridiales bacterium]
MVTEKVLETEEREESSGNESENIKNEDVEEEISVISDTTEQSGSCGENLTWTLSEDGTLTISGTGDMDDYSTPDQLPWHDVELIKKVIIEEGVTSIGNEAFWECTQLMSVEIPGSVTCIGSNAFEHCGFTSITLPDSVTSIGGCAFQRCSITGITIPDKVTSIGFGVFAYSALESLIIPDSVTSIEDNAFAHCNSLTSIDIPDSVTSIGNNAFEFCGSLTSITIPDSVTSIADGTFGGCRNLESISIPDSVTSIENYAFNGCFSLTSINIPAGVTNIGDNAFSGCDIASITIPDGVTSIGRRTFSGCSNLASINIPASVTSIGDNAFSDCDKLTNVDYAGGKKGWESIEIGDNNESLLNSNIKYNGTDNDTEKPSVKEPEDKSDESKPDNNKTTGSLESEPDSKPDDTPWTPTTPEEKKRYDCVGKDSVKYTVAGNGAYPVMIVNIMQGPKCFESFEAGVEALKVLGAGNYTISRTFDIYPNNKRNTYNMGQEAELTITIPADISRTGRQYKMLCVTEGGIVVILDDLDPDPNTITIRTDKFHAFALIYK